MLFFPASLNAILPCKSECFSPPQVWILFFPASLNGSKCSRLNSCLNSFLHPSVGILLVFPLIYKCSPSCLSESAFFPHLVSLLFFSFFSEYSTSPVQYCFLDALLISSCLNGISFPLLASLQVWMFSSTLLSKCSPPPSCLNTLLHSTVRMLSSTLLSECSPPPSCLNALLHPPVWLLSSTLLY